MQHYPYMLDIPAHLWIVCFQTAMHPLVLIRSSIGLGGLKRWRDEHRRNVAQDSNIQTVQAATRTPGGSDLGKQFSRGKVDSSKSGFINPLQQTRTINRISLCIPNLELWMIFVFSSYTRSGVLVVPPQDPHLNEIRAWRWSFHRIHQENPWKVFAEMELSNIYCADRWQEMSEIL